mmetsp:Transcript_32744/g.86051  ORF Transcript_32744/g.86051 Transcript_32744/m.86051 type:complete len:157 (-) Transcript_32744:245-715(-)
MSAPSEIIFNGVEVTLLTYKQLEQQSRKNLMIKVRSLQDMLGADNLPTLTGHGPDITIEWILSVQIALCRGKGIALTPANFGAPAAANSDGFFGRGEAMPQSQKQITGSNGQWSHSQDTRAPMQDFSNANTNFGAYEEACQGAQAARMRNMGSQIF